MVDFFIIYLPIMFTIEVSSEIWNCANPRPFPVGKYYMCEWNPSDLMFHKGKWILRPRDIHDNYFEDDEFSFGIYLNYINYLIIYRTRF